MTPHRGLSSSRRGTSQRASPGLSLQQIQHSYSFSMFSGAHRLSMFAFQIESHTLLTSLRMLHTSSALSALSFLVSVQKNILFFCCYCFKNPEYDLSFHLILLWLFYPMPSASYPCIPVYMFSLSSNIDLECCLSQHSLTVTEYLGQSSYK